MSARSFVTRQLEKHRAEGEKKPRAERVEEMRTSIESAAAREDRTVRGPVVTIYDDTDVCKALGLKKRVLVSARTIRTFCTDWGLVGMHAGMTEKWIREKNPSAVIPEPVKEADGITTMKAVSRCMNRQCIMCMPVGGTKIVVVHCKDATLLHLGDQFDCEMIGTKYYYSEKLNPEPY